MVIIDQILDGDEYVREETKKRAIFIHHTSGGFNPSWTISAWNTDTRGRIATAFVIGGQQIKNGKTVSYDMDGKIYRAFDEKYWSYHLGAGLTRATKYSVGIEICNYGYLYKHQDGSFRNYVHSIIPDDQVIEIPDSFRGYRYWHRYTDAQIHAVEFLLHMLADKFKIDISSGIPAMLKGGAGLGAFDFVQDATQPADGVWSHTSVRRDKTDVCPQPQLMELLCTL